MTKRRSWSYAVWAVFVVWLCLFLPIPYASKDWFYCLYCGARRSDTRCLWYHYPPTITEGPFTAYWRQNVQKGHTHTWRKYAFSRQEGLGGVHGDIAGNKESYLTAECRIAVLASFKTPSERLAFAKAFLVWDARKEPKARNEWHLNALIRLQEAYQQNPARKDWQRILKKLGI